MVITPESENDYVQFTIGTQSWSSSDKAICTVGGWDPRNSNPAVGRSLETSCSDVVDDTLTLR